ncbi:MAG: PilZ domain-containing protein, partial [Polyangiaceae bacterium]
MTARAMTMVSLSVRYKSVTVDDFVERHALDVSARGIYVKTERPAAIGKMVELDIQIADKQTVIVGVGRVVWRREPAQATAERPSGIGVKFVWVDKASHEVIERMVASRPDAGRRYEAEPEMTPSPDAAVSGDAPAAPGRGAASVTGSSPRPAWYKATLAGVGAPGGPFVSPTLPAVVSPPRRKSSSIPPIPHTTRAPAAGLDPDAERDD